MKKSQWVAFALPFLIVLPLVYGFEVFLALSEFGQAKIDFLKEKRTEGIPMSLAVTPNLILASTQMQGLRYNNEKILPLGSLSKTPTLYCREGEGFMTYLSDRYGFHNPDSVWEGEVSLAVVGDSYVQGYCVPSEKNWVSLIRTHHPNTINLGSFSNGPLSNLATIKEYLLQVKPQRVLWTYIPNDLGLDLHMESQSPILMNYLKDSFSQKIQGRQAQFDHALSQYLSQRIQRQEVLLKKQSWRRVILSLRLKHFMKWLMISYERKNAPKPKRFMGPHDTQMASNHNYELFQRVLLSAQKTVTSWGGQLTFLFIPDAKMFYSPQIPGAISPEKLKERIRPLVESLGIPFIDIHKKIKDSGENPFTYYTPLGGEYGHFNRMGYQKVASWLLKELK